MVKLIMKMVMCDKKNWDEHAENNYYHNMDDDDDNYVCLMASIMSMIMKDKIYDYDKEMMSIFMRIIIWIMMTS